MYTQDLIDEVKRVYPTFTAMHELAENGSAFLGRYLDDNKPNGISIGEVLQATSLEELKEKARTAQEKIDLYAKWCKQDPRRISKE